MAKDRVITITNIDFLNKSGNKFLQKSLIPIAPKNVGIPEIIPNGKKYIALDDVQYRDYDSSEIELYENTANDIAFTDYKDFICLRLPPNLLKEIKKHFNDNNFMYISYEGYMAISNATIYFTNLLHDSDHVIKSTQAQRAKSKNNAIFESLDFKNLDIPPNQCAVIPESDGVEDDFHAGLMISDPELFGKQQKRFLLGENTYINMLQAATDIPSDLIEKHFRTMNLFQRKFNVACSRGDAKKTVKHDLKGSNEFWKHKTISFIDGGMSTMMGLPRLRHQFIEVGDFTVRPGKRDETGTNPAIDRERFLSKSYEIHNIFNDNDIIQKDEFEEFNTDTTKRNECARYICEAHYALMRAKGLEYDDVKSKWIESQMKPDVLLFHGPLEYKFEMYTQNKPHYIPGMSKKWLEENGITKDEIKECFGEAYSKSTGIEWNAPMTVYGYILKSLEKLNIPVLGCVERTVSYQMIKAFVSSYMIDPAERNKIIKTAKKFDLKDDKLFGFVLNEREYLKPLKLEFMNRDGQTVNAKNMPSRLSDENYIKILKSYPRIQASILNCSFRKLPFRIEMFEQSEGCKYSTEELISLVYHNSILLGEYLFPVGLDVIDKFVKIPDSLSRAVDSSYAVKALNNAVRRDIDDARRSGEPNTGRYMYHTQHKLTRRSIRDSWTRPNESRFESGKRSK